VERLALPYQGLAMALSVADQWEGEKTLLDFKK
jgi:hypothetical protein